MLPKPVPNYSTINLCEHPPWVIASDDFNAAPLDLSLAGVRESNHDLFSKLEAVTEAKLRGQVFHDYLDVKFALHQWANYQGKARSSLRNSYLRFLRGWEVDSNSTAGAVLKSWVQSRFGIAPTYHRGILAMSDGEEDERFATDRMKGNTKTNNIFSQLDLLYEFCQYELRRRFPDDSTRLLYRGTNDPEEHPVISREDRGRSCVRLNNLVSFTADREKAWEFGSTVWETTVAHAKVIFFSGLLPDHLLHGEQEYLVVGGNYRVRELLY